MQDTTKHIDLTDLATFKFWAIQNPNAVRLATTIIFQWRNASAIVRGRAGKWIVYPRQRWIEWSGLSLHQVKRALKCLEEDGLILRERHRFAGTEVRTFIQPTPMGIKYLGRQSDMKRLESPKAVTKLASKYTPKTAKAGPANAPITAPTSAPTSAPTDYTPFPSLPPVSPAHKGGSTTDDKGKGKGTQKEKKGKGQLTDHEAEQAYEAEQAALTESVMKMLNQPDPDELAYQQKKADAQADRLAKVKAITKDKKLSKDQRRTKLLALLPKDPCAPASLWHPSDQYPIWHTWSAEKLIEKQNQYDEYVANTKAKGGKTSKSFY